MNVPFFMRITGYFLMGSVLFNACYEGICLINLTQIKTPARRFLTGFFGGILGICCFVRFGFNPAGFNILALFGVLAMISLIDLERREIPDRLNILVCMLGFLSNWTVGGISWQSRMIGFFCVSLPMLLLSVLTGGGFGGGDVKLMAASGIFLGWQQNLTAVCLAFFLGGIYGIWLLLSQKAGRRDSFAFGPFLCTGIILVLLIGGAGLPPAALSVKMVQLF